MKRGLLKKQKALSVSELMVSIGVLGLVIATLVVSLKRQSFGLFESRSRLSADHEIQLLSSIFQKSIDRAVRLSGETSTAVAGLRFENTDTGFKIRIVQEAFPSSVSPVARSQPSSFDLQLEPTDQRSEFLKSSVDSQAFAKYLLLGDSQNEVVEILGYSENTFNFQPALNDSSSQVSEWLIPAKLEEYEFTAGAVYKRVYDSDWNQATTEQKIATPEFFAKVRFSFFPRREDGTYLDGLDSDQFMTIEQIEEAWNSCSEPCFKAFDLKSIELLFSDDLGDQVAFRYYPANYQRNSSERSFSEIDPSCFPLHANRCQTEDENNCRRYFTESWDGRGTPPEKWEGYARHVESENPSEYCSCGSKQEGEGWEFERPEKDWIQFGVRFGYLPSSADQYSMIDWTSLGPRQKEHIQQCTRHFGCKEFRLKHNINPLLGMACDNFTPRTSFISNDSSAELKYPYQLKDPFTDASGLIAFEQMLIGGQAFDDESSEWHSSVDYSDSSNRPRYLNCGVSESQLANRWNAISGRHFEFDLLSGRITSPVQRKCGCQRYATDENGNSVGPRLTGSLTDYRMICNMNLWLDPSQAPLCPNTWDADQNAFKLLSDSPGHSQALTQEEIGFCVCLRDQRGDSNGNVLSGDDRIPSAGFSYAWEFRVDRNHSSNRNLLVSRVGSEQASQLLNDLNGLGLNEAVSGSVYARRVNEVQGQSFSYSDGGSVTRINSPGLSCDQLFNHQTSLMSLGHSGHCTSIADPNRAQLLESIIPMNSPAKGSGLSTYCNSTPSVAYERCRASSDTETIRDYMFEGEDRHELCFGDTEGEIQL